MYEYLTQHTLAPHRHHQEQGDDSAPRLRCTLCSALHATGGGGGGEVWKNFTEFHGPR